jgi:AraC-like DNA-binding protein
VRQFHLGAALHDYFTGLYKFTIDCPADVLVEDQLHPEWSVMRFTAEGTPPMARIGPGPLEQTWPFVASGPTSKAIRFGLGTSRIWGIGLQPAGFAKFIPAPASTLADRIVDGENDPAFALFKPLLSIVRGFIGEPAAAARTIEKQLIEICSKSDFDGERILACQAALRDTEVATVADLCERVGVGRRSLERLCSRYFGFPPKMLQRRQRFLRSLAQFTVAGGGNWSKSLDRQYYDQAHFVRDFKAFMGMTPSEYADAPHPVLDPIMAQRMADQGALPATHLPTVLRYGSSGRR